MSTHRDVPEEQHKAMRAVQGNVHLETASDAFYFCWLDCQKDKHPWPETLDIAWKLVWLEMGRDEALRLQITGRRE